MKKPLAIILILISICLVLFLGWLLWGDNDTLTPDQGPQGLPFGSGDGLNSNLESYWEEIDESLMFDDQGVPKSQLFRISDAPVSGAIAITVSNQSIVRYVDRATGHIHEISLPKPGTETAVGKRKITNNTIPKIYKAHFRADGGAVLLRSLRNELDVQDNTIITLTATSTANTAISDSLYGVSASKLRGDIDSVAVGQGNNLFYVVKDLNTIVSLQFNNNSLRNIFTSAFNAWKLTPMGSNLLIHTKAATGVQGYAYTLNTANGSLTKLLGPLTSLAATPNKPGNRVFYSYNDGFLQSSVLNLGNNTNTEISPATLAEKCAWSEKNTTLIVCGVPLEPIAGTEPDSWYQGKTFFSDRVWKFDTNTSVAELLAEPKKVFDIDMDIIEPQVSPLEDYLIFINKRDYSLWALKLQ